MKFDITIFPDELASDVAIARRAEDSGFDGFWTAEVAHNPFFPLLMAGARTNRINLGTQIAVAFPRSPMVTAYTAWDLARETNGRFILGLGSQVKAHITRRFGIEWTPPVRRMREYIEVMRATWDNWQNGTPLRYKGQNYHIALMTPFFTPPKIEHPDIPIYIAGVNEKMCNLAGELCQGIHLHAFHTVRYLKEVVTTSIEAGLQTAGRSRNQIELTCPVFIVTGRNTEEKQAAMIDTKSRIAFYGSTPSYAAVMELHGWQEVGARLSKMARNGEWDQMWKQISDEMLEQFAVVAEPDEVFDALRERYTGLVDRICLGYDPNQPFTEVMFEEATKAHNT